MKRLGSSVRLSGIYVIRNKENDKIYIGSSFDIIERWRVHKIKLCHNKHNNKHLQNAYNLYNPDSFEFSILEECGIGSLLTKEQYYIDTMNPEYNIAEKTSSPMLGRKHSEETKKLLSDKAKLKEHSIASKEKLRNANLGKKHSEETKLKMSQQRKGRKHSEETKQKLSDARRRNLLGLA